MIAADDDGEASLSIDHPADLLSVYSDPTLDAVASDFCTTFAVLLAHLDVPVPAELSNVS